MVVEDYSESADEVEKDASELLGLRVQVHPRIEGAITARSPQVVDS